MLIESIIRRKGGTHVKLDNTVYHFAPSKDEPRHLAMVDDADHIQTFLSIKDGYRRRFGRAAEKAEQARLAVEAKEQAERDERARKQAERAEAEAKKQAEQDGEPRKLHIDQHGDGKWFVKAGGKFASDGFETEAEAVAEMERQLAKADGKAAA